MFLYIGKPVPESPPGTAPHRSGNVLLSQAVPRQVSSTRKSLTTVFGMGTGGSSLLSSPEYIVCSWLPPLAAIGKIPLGAPPLVLLRRTGIFLPLLRSARGFRPSQPLEKSLSGLRPSFCFAEPVFFSLCFGLLAFPLAAFLSALSTSNRLQKSCCRPAAGGASLRQGFLHCPFYGLCTLKTEQFVSVTFPFYSFPSPTSLWSSPRPISTA